LRLAEPLPYKQNVPAFGTLLASAYEHREDLRERELVVQQAEQARLETRAQYAPTIVAEAGPKVSVSPHAYEESSSRRTVWSADIAVKFPFFDGGQRELDLVNKRLLIDQAVLEKELLSKKIEGQVKEAWLKVQTLEGSLTAVKAQVKAAEQGYADLQNQYSAGTAKSVDVLSALQDLSSARLDLTSLTLDYEVALRGLEQFSGTFQDLRVRQLMERKR
jgi:outer membrane protein